MKAGSNPIDVTGFADRTGNRAANVALAQRRAAAVRDALVAKGIPDDHVRSGNRRTSPVPAAAREAGRVEVAVGK